MICLITGARRGLGQFLAQRFWQAGYSLALVARPGAASGSLPSFQERPNQTVRWLEADLADPESVSRLIAKANAEFPALDVLINNAAIHGTIGPSWESDFAAWRLVLQVNLLTPIELCGGAVEWMGQSGGGAIINLSGGGATAARPNFSPYATSKAGLVRFSETLAEEAKPLGVRVNCVAPGPMKTDMLAEVIDRGPAFSGQREFDAAQRVFRDGGTPMDRVADLCLFLSSPSAREITGKLISAVWDPWSDFLSHLNDLRSTDIYTLRRIVPKDRGKAWGNDP